MKNTIRQTSSGLLAMSVIVLAAILINDVTTVSFEFPAAE
jgi:hypothetical protein